MKKIIKILGRISFFYLLYVFFTGILPFAKPPSLSKQFKEGFDLDDFHTPDQGKSYGKPLSDNDQARRAKLKAIRYAKESIYLTTYRYIIDETGLQFMKELLEAADRGVRVKLLIDGCSFLTFNRVLPYLKVLHQHDHIEVGVYNPIQWLKPWTIQGRMHDKYLLVDDHIIFLGGRNITNRFNTTQFGEINYDWDTFIYVEKASQDDAVDQLKTYIDTIWQEQTVKTLDEWTSLTTPPFLLEKARDSILQASYENDLKPIDYKKGTAPLDRVCLIHNPIHPYVKQPTIFYQISKLLKDADQSVMIHTPYYIADQTIKEHLRQVAEQVDTSLLTNSVSNSRNQLGAMELYVNGENLLETGVQVLLLNNTHPYHGKVIRIDDDISLVGSFNWDMRSTYINTEMMMVIKSKAYYSLLKEAMGVFEDQATQLTVDSSHEERKKQQSHHSNPWMTLLYSLLYILTYPIRFLL